MSKYPDTLRLKSTGTVVKWLQSLLIARGYTVPISGVFDSGLLAAVNDWQTKRKLGVDGIVGPKTWASLLPVCVDYKQMDPRWGSKPFTVTGDKNQTIKSSGCGPTCMAMIAASWGHPEITPVEMCDAAIKGGFRTANNGVTRACFADQAKKFGYRCRENNDIADVTHVLGKGGLVVANMGAGYWTKYGHYIVLWACDPYSAVIYANDPGSSTRYRASIDSIRREAKKFLIFERR